MPPVGDASLFIEAAPLEPGAVMVAGDEHGCALNRDGRAWCWGRGKAGRTNATASVTSIAAGAWHTCGLAAGGRPHCWGQRYWSAPTDSGFVERCGGSGFACGRDEAGAVRCWGGDSEPRPPTTPFAVPIQRLVCGSYAVCGLDLDGEVACWHAEVREAVARRGVGVAAPGLAVNLFFKTFYSARGRRSGAAPGRSRRTLTATARPP